MLLVEPLAAVYESPSVDSIIYPVLTMMHSGQGIWWRLAGDAERARFCGLTVDKEARIRANIEALAFRG